MPKMRFAALVRVSIERQEEQSESLLKQRSDLRRDVQQLKGTIVEWYGGQEHATPDWEKAEVDRLLSDAQNGRFDAIIVHHEDRWSRDNAKSSAGLDLLEKRGTRFFVRSDEIDLRDERDRFGLEFHVLIGQYNARTQARKSMGSRVHRAERIGAPTCGRRPFGRVWGKKTGNWSIDPAKQKIIRDVARRYLRGESMASLAERHDMNHASLHKTLTKRCGTVWEQHFNTKDGPVIIPTAGIPPLLPEKTIQQILQRVKSNKTYTHGQPKRSNYLLGRMIFCGHCGYAMFGQTNHKDRRYYRHAHQTRCIACDVPKGWVFADEIEKQVMDRLFETYRNPVALQRAIEAAIPNRKQVDENTAEVDRLTGELSKIEKARGRIIGLIAKDLLKDNQAETQLGDLKARETKLTAELQRLQHALANIVTPEQIRETVRTFHGHRIASTKRRIAAYTRPTSFEDQRALCELVFAGQRGDGKRNGIYVVWNNGKWDFRLFGKLPTNSALH
jgi:site-specific DNA recombinase